MLPSRMNCSRAALPASSPEMGCPMFAQFFRANVGPRAILREFPCSPRRCLPAVAGPSAAEPAEEGGTPLCPSHKAARNPVLSLLFSINYNGTYNLLKTGTIKTFVFTLMRTLSPQVPCYEQTNKNIPGVWVPPPLWIYRPDRAHPWQIGSEAFPTLLLGANARRDIHFRSGSSLRSQRRRPGRSDMLRRHPQGADS